MFTGQKSLFTPCLSLFTVLFTYYKILKIDPTVLFTHLKIILLQYFQFSVSATINSIQTDPKYHTVCILHTERTYITKYCFMIYKMIEFQFVQMRTPCLSLLVDQWKCVLNGKYSYEHKKYSHFHHIAC